MRSRPVLIARCRMRHRSTAYGFQVPGTYFSSSSPRSSKVIPIRPPALARSGTPVPGRLPPRRQLGHRCGLQVRTRHRLVPRSPPCEARRARPDLTPRAGVGGSCLRSARRSRGQPRSVRHQGSGYKFGWRSWYGKGFIEWPALVRVTLGTSIRRSLGLRCGE